MDLPIVNTTDLIEENYRDYGQYINNKRAVPGIDGLKSVYRRMLLAVRDEASKQMTRSAQVVGACLVGSTKVILPNNTKVTLEQLHREKPENFSIYSSNKGISCIEVAQRVELTKYVNKIVRIHTESGIQECTPDHEWELRGNVYVQAQDLQVGDKLIAFKFSTALKEIVVFKHTHVVTEIEIVNLTEFIPVYDIINVSQTHNFVVMFNDNTAIIAHNCLGRYQPHGESSAYNVLVRLVNSGFVKGQGNFGKQLLESLPAASLRYTYVKAHPEFNESVFKLIDYVPTSINEFGNKEPDHLPVPIPLCLTTGSLGIGLGLLTSIPIFNPKSIYEAMMRDNPEYLKAPKDIFITAADLPRIWETGEGWIQYGLRCYQEWSHLDGKDVSIIEGSTKAFSPNVDGIFEKELEEEIVYRRDESKSQLRVIVSRVKNIRRISDSFVHDKCRVAATHMKFVRIYITTGEIATRISLREWLRTNWSMYQDTIDLMKKDKLEKLDYKIKVYNLIPKVYPLLIANKTSSSIASKLEVPQEIVTDIESKPMRLLRKTCFNQEIKNLNDRIASTKLINAKTLGTNVIDIITEAQSK